MRTERIIYGLVAGVGIYVVLKGVFTRPPGTPPNETPIKPPVLPPGINASERKVLAYAPIVKLAGLTHMVDPALISAVIERESGGKADARGSSREVGLMQILPSTGAGFCGKSEAMLWDIPTNIDCGTKYLASTIKMFSSVPGGVAAYNCGPGRVERDFVTQKFVVPASTRRYALAVLEKAQRYRQIWVDLMPEYKLYFPDYPWAVSGAGSFL